MVLCFLGHGNHRKINEMDLWGRPTPNLDWGYKCRYHLGTSNLGDGQTLEGCGLVKERLTKLGGRLT